MTYPVLNQVGDELASQFVHGTDTSMVLTDASEFSSDGGYVVVRTSNWDHWALYEYTGITTNTLTGLTACTLGVVESEAAYTFPAGSLVERTNAAEDIKDRDDAVSPYARG